VITPTRINQVIAAGGPRIVYQPIVSLAGTVTTLGYEALARFEGNLPPNLWFAAAWQEDYGRELEHVAIENAIAGFRPELGYLAINATPRALIDSGIRQLLTDAQRNIPLRIVVELSESQTISDYGLVRTVVTELRQIGVTLSIDDLGAGFSSLLHVLELEPESLKIDIRFVSQVPADHRYNAIVAAIVAMAKALNVECIAEGVESIEQANALRILGVSCAQGWHFGKPGALP
jgi:EAL domain-containing protein (putative c-di-GMP-specific phosphodiesterase class I)